MDLLQIFDVNYCNQQLNILSSKLYESFDTTVTVHEESFPPTMHSARKIIKKYIQLAQIFMAIQKIVGIPHLQKSLKKMRVLANNIDDYDFMYELESTFDSEYGDNHAQNYAISIKRLREVIMFHEQKINTLFNFIFHHNSIEPLTCKQVTELVDVTKTAIQTFLNQRNEATQEAFHMLEVFVEQQRFKKIVLKIESLENNFLT
jgi:hypothetical protein